MMRIALVLAMLAMQSSAAVCGLHAYSDPLQGDSAGGLQASHAASRPMQFHQSLASHMHGPLYGGGALTPAPLSPPMNHSDPLAGDEEDCGVHLLAVSQQFTQAQPVQADQLTFAMPVRDAGFLLSISRQPRNVFLHAPVAETCPPPSVLRL